MIMMFENMTHLAGHALFAVCALPLVAGDVVDEVEVEADAGWVARGVALGTVQKHLGLQGKWSIMVDSDDVGSTCPALLWFMCPWQFLQIAPGLTSSTFFIGPFVSFFTSSFTFSCLIFTSFRGRPLMKKKTGQTMNRIESLTWWSALQAPLPQIHSQSLSRSRWMTRWTKSYLSPTCLHPIRGACPS